jgi:hypothetical protein
MASILSSVLYLDIDCNTAGRFTPGSGASSHNNHWSKRAELPIADATHHHQMLRAAKRPVLLALRDDPFGRNLANARKFLQFVWRGGVDVY